MEKIMLFLNKYGILIHSLSIAFWIWMLSQNLIKIQNGTANTPEKISFYAILILLAASTLNLINAIRKFRK